jgi:hypothetical protein
MTKVETDARAVPRRRGRRRSIWKFFIRSPRQPAPWQERGRRGARTHVRRIAFKSSFVGSLGRARIAGVLDSGFEIPDSGFPIRDSRFRIRDSRFRVRDSRFRVRDSGFEIPDSGFEIPDSQGNAFWVSNPESRIPLGVRRKAALERLTSSVRQPTIRRSRKGCRMSQARTHVRPTTHEWVARFSQKFENS